MKFRKLTPEVITDKVVIIRVDFNVPLKDGQVKDATRIVESIPTLKFILENNPKELHILTHAGRPKGQVVPEVSTKHLVSEIEKNLGEKIEFRPDYSKGTEKIQLHENCRFYPGEKKNDPALGQEIFDKIQPDIFIIDGFAVCHRAQASVIGLADKVPCYPGFLVEKEIESLSPFLTDKKLSGLTVLIGGLKMETKVPVLRHFAKVAENILVGGGLANTFQVAKGVDVGASLYEEEQLEAAREVMEIAKDNNTNFLLPTDTICAENIESTDTEEIAIEEVTGNKKIFDIGSQSINQYAEILKNSSMIIWNGPMGVMEKEQFQRGTKEMLMTIKDIKSAKTILGGGDTLKSLKKWDVAKSEFSHVSTGGGAMLEFLAGNELPGFKILEA